MVNSRFSSTRPATNRGFALIVTLATVVLLTFLIVAFFSAVTASRKLGVTRTGGVSADLLAQGALAAIESDLLAEIRASSSAIVAGANTFYTPNANANMLPQRAVDPSIETDPSATGYPAFVNLVKQSGHPFFTNAPIFGFTSTNGTAIPARNGRVVNPVRWSAPMLTGADFSAAQAPKWVYINRDGYATTASDKTIGRMAFNVFDIGGLLDANVAGFAPKLGGTQLPDEAGTKGPAVWADLRVLPGIEGSAFTSSSVWPPQWRITGDWATFTSDGASTSFKYYQRTGWLQAFQTAAGAASDRMFASRQDLIRYAKANSPGTFQPDPNGTSILPALQYLTTFSRALEQPSFQPDPDRPKVLNATENDAHGRDNQINPSLLTATKANGAPAVTKRFPLSRLSLVATPVPPSDPPNDADILKHFGLTWDATNNRWSYEHGSPGDILRLTDVPADRDPDFFELLKGALIVGSLGKQYGVINPPGYRGLGLPSELGRQDASINYQIIQIAANIIDQSDSDSYPTRILFDGREFYGREDLPGLYRARYYQELLGAIPSWAPKSLITMRITPELWNPHRAPAVSSGATPVNFRIVGDTSLGSGLRAATFIGPGGFLADYTSEDPGAPDCDSPISYTPGQGASSGNANAGITFSIGTGSASFREPTELDIVSSAKVPTANGFPSGVPDMAPSDTSSPRLPGDPAAGRPDTVVFATNANRLGFLVGYAIWGPGPLGPYKVVQSWGGPLALELQYQDPTDASRWWTVDRMNQCSIRDPNNWIPLGGMTFILSRTDPRTDRWGSVFKSYNTVANLATIPTGRTSNPVPGTWLMPVDLEASAPGWVWGGPQGERARVQRNSSGDILHYKDPDNVLRRGDSAYASDATSRGWPQNTGNNDSRPVMLNRPFRSVAELGHVFRGTPWKSLDLMTPESGDRALLDVFCLTESPEDRIVAGRVNLNTRQAPVIQALIQGVALVDGNTTIADSLMVERMTRTLTDFTAGTDPGEGPLRDRSELVGRFVSGTTFVGAAQGMANELAVADRPIAFNRDAIVAALADAVTTREWNVLIDVIAQSGMVSPSGEFIPQGESRLWHSLAIDRPTATVIDHSTEVPAE